MPDYNDFISEAEGKYGLPPGMLSQLISTESSFNPNAVNKTTGATGLAQALPSTAKDPGYGIKAFDPTDPKASIDFAGHYLSVLKGQTGSWENALRHYGTLAGKAGMAYDAAPQNQNQALLLSLAQHGDTSGARPDPWWSLSNTPRPPNDPRTGLPRNTDPPMGLSQIGTTMADAIQAATGWRPGTTPSWTPQWAINASNANMAAEQAQRQDVAGRYHINPDVYDMALGFAGPIEAWHGTGAAADFAKFDPAFAGTGEGSALYGHAPGGYHAEAQATGESYDQGQLLKTLINAEPEDFLHWQEPLSEQHPDVRAQVRDVVPSSGKDLQLARRVYQNATDPDFKALMRENLNTMSDVAAGTATGEDIYQYLMRMSGEDNELLRKRYATQQLSEAGLPGIRYYDDFLHYPGEPGPKSHSYAVFDPDLVKILERLGVNTGGQ